MKKRYILIALSVIYTTIIIILRLPGAIDNAINKAVDNNKEFVHAYNTCDIALEQKRYKTASECFGELLKKYDRNDIRYNYASALAQIKEYDKAKKELEYIIENEKNFTEVVENAKHLNKQIDDILKILRSESKNLSDVQTKNVDAGDYLNELNDYTLWENPKNITVYIKDDPKKDLFLKGFMQWKKALGEIFLFEFTDNPNANIACSYTNVTESNEGGVTDWYYIEKNGVQYFQKSTIKVARRSPITGKPFTDDQKYSIILHEIGHALGISDHSSFKGDIMYFSNESFLTEKGMISNRDINTLKKMYKVKS